MREATPRSDLERLGVPLRAIDEILAAGPPPGEFVERQARVLLADMGGFEPLPEWPPPPDPWAYVWVFLAVLPAVREYHRARGIDDAVSWATLSDLGRAIGRDRDLYGGGFHTHWWLALHFRGGIYELGRLQFNRGHPKRSPAKWGLGVHIPEAGPLAADACDASFAAARSFFRRHFPDEPYELAHCVSWLLDPQLAEYLPPDSNIVRFARRFELIPELHDGDADVIRFVFHRQWPTDLDQLPRRTTVERAIVDHLRAGNHWHVRAGSFEL